MYNKEIKIFLARNTKKEKDTHPDLRLAQITEDGEFIDIGALWLSKDPNKKTYTGKLDLNKLKIQVIPEEDEELNKVAAVFDKKPDNYPKYDNEPAF